MRYANVIVDLSADALDRIFSYRVPEDMKLMPNGYELLTSPAKLSRELVRLSVKKIEDDSENPTLIQTVWGIGYRFNSGDGE